MSKTKISIHNIEGLFRETPGCKLYSLKEVPSFQCSNQYITHGYRSFLSGKQCLASAFMKSNEFMNIWSHAVGFLLFFMLFFYDRFVTLPSISASRLDYVIFFVYYFGVLSCMACSTLFHTFNCHVHEKVAKMCFAADLFGILMGIMGCYNSGLYYGFYCTKVVQHSYVGFILIMTLISGGLMVTPRYFLPEWNNIRIAHLTVVVLTAFFPTVHWYMSSPKMEIDLFFSQVLTFYCILALALVVYLAKCPERYYPGYFNFVGSSHNWWHVMALAAFLYWRNIGIQLVQYRIASKCPDLKAIE